MTGRNRLLIAGLNLNRGLAVPKRRAALLTWLAEVRPDVLLLQETQSPRASVCTDLPGYRRLVGELGLTTWCRDEHATPGSHRSTWWQTAAVSGMDLHNVHLDPSSSAGRASQLVTLANELTGRPRTKLLVGDFNLAPRAEDGMYAGQASRFTSQRERDVFARLLDGNSLVDMLATDPVEFTFERDRAGVRSAFRCDLALVDEQLAPSSLASYDHSTRAIFTDHSAVLVSVPRKAPTTAPEAGDILDMVRPAHTAMRRTVESPWARWIATRLCTDRPGVRILDYGCGHGRDIRYYRANGFEAYGYDPAPEFCATAPPQGRFSVVALIYVLNTVPRLAERVRIMRRAADFLDDDGVLVVVTRSPEEIAGRASHHGWSTVGDGYWSSEKRKTFQRGIGSEELRHMGLAAQLVSAESSVRVPSARSSTSMAFRRPSH